MTASGRQPPSTVPSCAHGALAAFQERCRRGGRLRALLLLATLLTGSAYFIWRAGVMNPAAPVFSAVFYMAEGYGFLSLLLTVVLAWRILPRQPPAPPPGLSVDVLIPVCDEPLSLIRVTAYAAVQMRYPHRTWLLDDGRRDELQGLAAELGCHYLRRADNRHAKAGNLNHALRHCHGDLVAILDADHVPEAWMLERLLGYFTDPQLGLVQTPQAFHNLESPAFLNAGRSRYLWHDQSFFYGIGQAGRDAHEAASLCGTGCILRRQALDQVGGFATATVTEDMHTAVRLARRGWRARYHPEPVAFGQAAVDLGEFLQQRLRWGHGNVQTLREERLPFGPGLSGMQRLAYTLLGTAYFEGWSRLVLYFTPPLVMLTGLTPIGDTRWFFYFFVPYALAAWLLLEEIGRGDGRWFRSEVMAMARFPVSLLATLGLVRRRRHWRITRKQRAARGMGWLLLPQMLVLLANLLAVLLALTAPPLRLQAALSADLTGVIGLWAALNAALAGAWLLHATRDSHTMPAAGVAVRLPLQWCAADGAWNWTESRRLDAEQVLLRDALPPELSHVRLRCFLPGGVFEFEVRLTQGRRGGAIGVPQWQREVATHRDEFSRLLHAATWWRALEWPAAPLPLLQSLWRPGRPAQPPPWTAVVIAAADAVPQLAFVREQAPGTVCLLCFGTAAAAGVTVLSPATEPLRQGGSLRALSRASHEIWPGAWASEMAVQA